MNQRPFSVTIAGSLLVAAGAVGLAYHLRDFKTLHPFPYDALGINLVRLLAIVAGVFMLRGSNWARWLGLAWIAFHVVVSSFHSMAELAVHGLLLAMFSYLLLRRESAEYFRGKTTTTP